MGCNDKECRLLGLSPNPFQSYLVTVAGIHDAYVCTRTRNAHSHRFCFLVVLVLDPMQQHASKIITIDLEVEKESG